MQINVVELNPRRRLVQYSDTGLLTPQPRVVVFRAQGAGGRPVRVQCSVRLQHQSISIGSFFKNESETYNTSPLRAAPRRQCYVDRVTVI